MKMIDVRNSHRKALRLNSVLKGYRAESTKQRTYLTWHRWGFDNKHISEKDFMAEFYKEWEIVLSHNMDCYGRDDPWFIMGGTYQIKGELKK